MPTGASILATIGGSTVLHYADMRSMTAFGVDLTNLACLATGVRQDIMDEVRSLVPHVERR